MATEELKKTKLKRRFYLLVFVLLIVVISCYNFFKVKNYSKEYSRDDVLIKESYNKEQNSYLFNFNYLDEDYVYALYKDYSWQKKLVKKIDILKNDNETCLVIKSDYLNFYPLCRSNGEQISYLLTSEEMKSNFNLPNINYEEETKYNDITIYNYFYHNYYLWNYRGFDYLSSTKNEKIDLFDKDVYDPKLIIKTNNYLFVPDYNSNYYFTKVYLINALNGKVSTWDLDKTIYFDSIVLGVIDNEVYLLDKHEDIEWKLNLAKKKIEKIGSKNKNGLFYDNEWLKLSLNKISEEKEFKGLNSITFSSDKGLKANILDNYIKLKNEDVKIIGFNYDTVYYLIDDVLYEYSFTFGEVKLLSKFEWNFNNLNTIFIF